MPNYLPHPEGRAAVGSTYRLLYEPTFKKICHHPPSLLRAPLPQDWGLPFKGETEKIGFLTSHPKSWKRTFIPLEPRLQEGVAPLPAPTYTLPSPTASHQEPYGRVGLARQRRVGMWNSGRGEFEREGPRKLKGRSLLLGFVRVRCYPSSPMPGAWVSAVGWKADQMVSLLLLP